jgi:hypothetical protein
MYSALRSEEGVRRADKGAVGLGMVIFAIAASWLDRTLTPPLARRERG